MGTRARWVVLSITGLAAALRLAGLGDQSFWFDECFTYTVTRAPLSNSLEALLVAGIYSPLYFLLLRPLTALAGFSEYAFRFPSAAFGTLTVPVIYHLGRRLMGERAGVLAALLLALCPFHIWYSQDARMYAPLVFFSLAAMERFTRVMRGGRHWAAFAACSGLAYLMHYAALSLIYVQLVHLLPHLKRARLVRRWFLAQAAAAAPLLPWAALYVVRGIRPAGLDWIPRPGLLAPLRTLWNFTTGDVETFTPLVALLAIGTAAAFLRGLFPWDALRRLLTAWLALPVGALFLLSLRRPYYVDRYLIISLPPFLLLLAAGLAAWRAPLLRILTTGAVLIAMLWGVVRLHTDPYFAREDWRGATAAVERELAVGDVVLLEDMETLIGTAVYRTREWPALVLSEDEAALAAADAHGRVWLIWRSPAESNHRLSKSAPFDVFAAATPPVRAWLAARQAQVAFDLRLPGLSVVRIDRP